MELHKIDSIQELRQERLRLQQEANVARELLHLKVQGTIDSGKKSLLGSWKVILPLVVAAGIQQFTGNNASTATTRQRTKENENAFIATFQEGFHAFQQPGNEKWVALIPIILRLWELWQDRQEDGPIPSPPAPTPVQNTASEGVPLREQDPATL